MEERHQHSGEADSDRHPDKGETGESGGILIGLPPLCVDLDGTLIAADSLRVSLRRLVIRRPWLLPVVAVSLRRGRAHFKKRVADFMLPLPETLPYRKSVLEFLIQERAQGRRIILATAADRRIADLVAGYLGLFTEILASDGMVNLKGINKLHAIRQHLQGGQFDYMGDSMADLPILECARLGYLVFPSPRLREIAQHSCRIAQVFSPR
jgi:phosphoserine phosphatase